MMAGPLEDRFRAGHAARKFAGVLRVLNPFGDFFQVGQLAASDNSLPVGAAGDRIDHPEQLLRIRMLRVPRES